MTMASSCGSGSSSKGSIMENVVDSITDAVDTLFCSLYCKSLTSLYIPYNLIVHVAECSFR